MHCYFYFNLFQKMEIFLFTDMWELLTIFFATVDESSFVLLRFKWPNLASELQLTILRVIYLIEICTKRH